MVNSLRLETTFTNLHIHSIGPRKDSTADIWQIYRWSRTQESTERCLMGLRAASSQLRKLLSTWVLGTCKLMTGIWDMCKILAELPLAEGAPAHCPSYHRLSSLLLRQGKRGVHTGLCRWILKGPGRKWIHSPCEDLLVQLAYVTSCMSSSAGTCHWRHIKGRETRFWQKEEVGGIDSPVCPCVCLPQAGIPPSHHLKGQMRGWPPAWEPHIIYLVFCISEMDDWKLGKDGDITQEGGTFHLFCPSLKVS
jgi:hypothetical protein